MPNGTISEQKYITMFHLSHWISSLVTKIIPVVQTCQKEGTSRNYEDGNQDYFNIFDKRPLKEKNVFKEKMVSRPSDLMCINSTGSSFRTLGDQKI